MGELETIPCLDFSNKSLYADQKSESWKELSNKVIQACEKHGCFLVKYNCEILIEQLFKEMKALFDLDEETKKKYIGAGGGRFSGYVRSPFSKLQESFGIDEANKYGVACDFTDLMWPQNGNRNLCEVINSMSSKMLDLNLIILDMVSRSFGCEIGNENMTTFLALIKYDASPTKVPAIGLRPHTDKNFITILCQNEVEALEVMSKDGYWGQVMIPNNYFMVIVGDSLKAWSNGKLHAAKHRVMMKGEKVRYSCGLFLKPKEDTKIEVPQRLVDEDHPLRYRSFTYSDYRDFCKSSLSDDVLELFAGV